MYTNAPPNTSTPRSQFITIFAWFSIAVSAMMVLMSILQNVMVSFLFPADMLDQLAKQGGENMPAFAVFVFSHSKAILLAFLLLSVLMLVLSIGFLKRKEWARITFVVLLALSIAASIGGLFVQSSMFESLPKEIEGIGQAEIEQMVPIFRGIMIGYTFVFSAIHAWLIYKLCTPQIRAEFA
ncbi:MAG: hypothetical protein ACRDAM_05600 [Casimicrobium sp.]